MLSLCEACNKAFKYQKKAAEKKCLTLLQGNVSRKQLKKTYANDSFLLLFSTDIFNFHHSFQGKTFHPLEIQTSQNWMYISQFLNGFYPDFENNDLSFYVKLTHHL